ncbi:MAG: DUF899 domain-containing protein [Parvibaculum sp.]|jgi:predicted dithiol-disulfide oxidoreductase (DUF899 family)|nr:DUF899 domain-containing protein [Parvibaculum sp.]
MSLSAENKPVAPPVPSLADRDKARAALLQKEKELMRLQDEIAAERRRLPWMEVTKDYRFKAPEGEVTLSDLFAGKSQLFIKHFMLSPGQTTQCVGCSLEVDHIAGLLEHFAANDISYVVVARAPLDEIEAVRQRMNWKFRWVSSYGTDFGYDFGVSFRPEDVAAGRARFRSGGQVPLGMEDSSGNDVFYKDDTGRIFHTYSVSGRGGERFLGIYQYIDSMPKGRIEPVHGTLADWARPNNLYGQGGTVSADGRYHASACGCAAHKA